MHLAGDFQEFWRGQYGGHFLSLGSSWGPVFWGSYSRPYSDGIQAGICARIWVKWLPISNIATHKQRIKVLAEIAISEPDDEVVVSGC